MKRLNDAIALSAFLKDAEGAGYLGLEDQNAVQKARVDLKFYCQRMALDFLHQQPNPITAKNAARQSVEQAIADFVARGAGEDELVPLQQLGEHLQQAIDREATKSELQRNFMRFVIRVPAIGWVLLVMVTITGIMTVVGSIVQS